MIKCIKSIAKNNINWINLDNSQQRKKYVSNKSIYLHVLLVHGLKFILLQLILNDC